MTNGNEPINSIPDLNNHPSSWYGLTKREYFAAMAMQGMMDKANWLTDAEYTSKQAVHFADALINALNEAK